MADELLPVTQAARELLCKWFCADNLGDIGRWVSSGDADNSTHTPALRAIDEALASTEALRKENEVLRAALEWLAGQRTIMELTAEADVARGSVDDLMDRMQARRDERDNAIIKARQALGGTEHGKG